MNENGTPANLTPFRNGNTSSAKHGIWSERLREPRAREIYDELSCASHLTDVDTVAVRELARILAFVEVVEAEFLVSVGGRNSARTKTLGDLFLRAEGKATALLDRCALTPRGRAEFAATLATPSLADELRRRVEEAAC